MQRLLVSAALAASLLVPLAPASAAVPPQCDNRPQRQQLESQKHALDRQLHAMPPPQRRAMRPQIEAQKRSLQAQIRQLDRRRKACERANRPPRHRRPDRDHDGD